MSDTNGAVQQKKMVSDLGSRGIVLLLNETKAVNSYCAAVERQCFRICKIPVFS